MKTEVIKHIEERNVYAFQYVFKEENYNQDIVNYLNETIDMAIKAKDVNGRIFALIIHACNCFGLHQYDKGFSILESINDGEIEQSENFTKVNYYSLYMIYYIEYKGDIEKSLQYAELELEYAHLHGDLEEIMRVRMNMASLYKAQGYDDTATDMYREIAEYYESVNNENGLAYVYINLGSSLIEKGMESEGEEYLEKTRVIARRAHLSTLELGADICLADLAVKRGDFKKALNYLEEKNLDFINSIENGSLEKDTSISFREKLERQVEIIKIYAAMKENEKAMELVVRIENQMTQIEDEKFKVKSYKLMADVAQSCGDYQKAYLYTKEYANILEDLDCEAKEEGSKKAIQEEHKREVERLDSLGAIGRELTILTDIDEMLLKLRNEFEFLLHNDSIGIGIVKGNALYFEHYFYKGIKNEPKVTRLDSEVSLAAWCVRNDQEVIINDLSNEYSKYVRRIGILDSSKDKSIQSVMMRPLKVGNEIIGVFTVQSYKINAYSSVESKIYAIISDYLAIAVNNAMQREALELLSVQDNLTKLVNRRGFIDFYREHIKNSEINSAGIIMLDLDYFKKINDTYGHSVGDFVLEEVGKVLKECIVILEKPFMAVASRLGGEEFALMCVQMNREGMLELAEEIRKGIESIVCVHKEEQVLVTASVGVVCRQDIEYDKRSEFTKNISYDRLYNDADKALYRAKHYGKNRVEEYK